MTIKEYPFYEITVNENSFWEMEGKKYYTCTPSIKNPFSFEGDSTKWVALTAPACHWWLTSKREFFALAITFSEKFGLYENKIETDSNGKEYIKCTVYEITFWLNDDFTLSPDLATPTEHKCRLYGFDKKKEE